MPTDTREKRQKRAQLVEEARAILSKADDEKRSLTAEDRQQYDRIWGEQGKLKTQIEDEERRNDLEREETKLRMRQEEEDRRQKAGEEKKKAGEEEEERRLDPRATEAYRSLYGKFLRATNPVLGSEEFRALQSDDDEAAGYLIVPEQTVEGILKTLDNVMIVRQLAQKITVKRARKLGIRKETAALSTFQWSAEIQDTQPHGDASQKFGKKELEPHYLSGELKISQDLLRLVPDVDSYMRGRLAYNAGVVQEQAFMTGDGAAKPLGLFTASDDGISTSRDVSTKNTTTELKPDNLYECKYTLPQQYRLSASNRWIMHRTTVKKIAQMKDGEGNYLWQMGLRGGEPDTVVGIPVVESEYAPSTFTTGLYVALLGDLQYYIIADALDYELRRLDELLARTNQSLFICRMKCDAMPVLEEAFVRSKLG